jgi:ribonucleoside-diphosphate reductase alpha chain
MNNKDNSSEIYSPNFLVQKRNGEYEEFDPQKIYERLSAMRNYPYSLNINVAYVGMNMISSIKEGMKTSKIDNYAVKVCCDMAKHHPDFLELASRIAVSNHQKHTKSSFSDVITDCYFNSHGDNKQSPLVSKELYKYVQHHKEFLNKIISYKRDYNFSYFGFNTLYDRYLLKQSDKKIYETPQDMWLRVATAIWMDRNDVKSDTNHELIKFTYNQLSTGYIMLASPMLFNAGTNSEQYSSCFLAGCDDSIEGIMKLNGDLGKISKYSGGVGFWTPLRSNDSKVKGVNGKSNGLVPFLGIYQATALAVNQGGKRAGSFAHYISPYHPDVMDWIELRRPLGASRLQHLFYGMWIPDIFMKCVEDDDDWYFFNPSNPLVIQEKLYTTYGKVQEKARDILIELKAYDKEPIRARTLWNEIMETQIQTGMPYMLYADACNRKSNQKNIGTIQSSNLCAEIILYSSPEEYAVCTLGAICLPKYVDEKTKTINYEQIASNAGLLTKTLDRVIDINFYPVEEAKRSNKRHRPLGIGVQGLADVFMLLKIPFTSLEAQDINKKLFEAIYYGALKASNELAKIDGPYSSFQDSPFSRGELQFHAWGLDQKELSGMFDWNTLIEDIKQYGVRNSQLTSIPPTASTSQIQGNNECIEPYASNLYVRKTLSGEHIMVNKHLMEHALERDWWCSDFQNQLIDAEGSVQDLPFLQDLVESGEVSSNEMEDFKNIYKTTWEMSGKTLINMAADRGAFIDQSQSMNVFMINPTKNRLSSMHIYGWKKGLKTGMYYLRSTARSKMTNFTKSICESCSI